MRRTARSDQGDSPPGRTPHRGWRRLAVAALAPLLALSATTATAQGVWVTIPPLPTPRYGLASSAADCPEGLRGTCVYAAGGEQAPEKFEAYSPSSGTWATLPVLKTPRTQASATTAPCPSGVRGDCVYVLGGIGTAARVAEAYSTETNAWLSLTPMLADHFNAGAATAPCPEGLRGTCVYVFGGNTGGTAEAYNPATNRWATVASLPTPRSNHAGASAPCPGDPNPRHLCVYAISGTNANTLSVEFYNPVNNQWGPAAEIPTARNLGRAATAPCPDGMSNGCIYVVGGARVPNTVEAYTPVTNAWVTLPSTPTGHINHGVAAAPCPKDTKHHCVYAIGSLVPGAAPTASGTTEAFAIERQSGRPQPRPEPTPAPTAPNGPRPDPAPAPLPKPDVKPRPDVKPQPEVKPQPDVKPWPKPEPKPDAKPAPKPPAENPQTDPAPDAGLDPDLDPGLDPGVDPGVDPELDLPADEPEDVR
ncbi:kelch repeat-containing protein [Streptomyces sp. NPDC056257]|uniref:Kelch repeat-containing protein n=1 Tax=Streptomyces sp. NPDC056257 TaxID=3345765 RepID=UPI0035D640EA